MRVQDAAGSIRKENVIVRRMCLQYVVFSANALSVLHGEAEAST